MVQAIKVEAPPLEQPTGQEGVATPVSGCCLRTTLPAPQASIEDLSLWGILRNNIGVLCVCVCVCVYVYVCVYVCVYVLCVHIHVLFSLREGSI